MPIRLQHQIRIHIRSNAFGNLLIQIRSYLNIFHVSVCKINKTLLAYESIHPFDGYGMRAIVRQRRRLRPESVRHRPPQKPNIYSVRPHLRRTKLKIG